MSATADDGVMDRQSDDPAAWCEEARRLAEKGNLREAAALFERVVGLGDTPWRAQAALGLAVIRADQGDAAGAVRADEIAIATKDVEYGPRAAYHLALIHEHASDRDSARDAWGRVIGFGNRTYLPPALLALSQLAVDEGDLTAARVWWRKTLDTRDEQYGPLAAHELAVSLLETGDAAAAHDVLLDGLRLVDPAAAPYAHARLAVNLGVAHMDQAIAAFQSVLDTEDPEMAPLAIELLARTLPLRGRDEEALETWRRGLDDPQLADAVRARLRRQFGSDEETGDLWWEPFVEQALCANTLPLLTGEAFGTLDHMFALIALRHAQGAEGLPSELYELLDQFVQVPGEYDWGRALKESFAVRLEQAMEPEAEAAPSE